MFTVRKMIDKLSKYPPNMEVVGLCKGKSMELLVSEGYYSDDGTFVEADVEGSKKVVVMEAFD